MRAHRPVWRSICGSLPEPLHALAGLFGVNLWGKDPGAEFLLVEPCKGCDITSIFDQVALAGGSIGPFLVVFTCVYIAVKTGYM